MANKHDLMAVMTVHSGKANGIKAQDLALLLSINTRSLRNLISQCREDGIAICGHPSTGYYVAQTREELEETVEFLKHRAMHSLKLASALARMPMEDLIGQLHLRT